MNDIIQRLKTFTACLCLLTLCTACSKEDTLEILSEVIKEMFSTPKENFDERTAIVREAGGENLAYGYVALQPGEQASLLLCTVDSAFSSTDYPQVQWTSDDESVAVLSPSKGSSTTVTMQAEGTATITATDPSGNTLYVTVTSEDAESEDPDYPDETGQEVFDSNVAVISNTNGVIELIEDVYREHPGNYIDVYLGDRETRQPYGYVNVRWYSDNEQVAQLTYETGNENHIDVGDVDGYANIYISDDAGNQITFRVECAESWNGRRQVSVRKVNK